jgi:mannose-6-phosphate isomerase
MKRVGPNGWGARLANPGKIPLELIEVQVGSYPGEDAARPRGRACQVIANETKVPIAVAIREARRLARSRSLNDMCAELPMPERTGD